MKRIAFARIAAAALDHAESLVPRWLPKGRRRGSEWVATNPTRNDRRLGSFKVSLRNGRWSDFATDQRGGDLVSLAAMLFQLNQGDAAIKIADMLGIDACE